MDMVIYIKKIPMLLLILLLIVSGTVEVNPGPAQRSIKYPCGTCEQSVYTGKSIACDSCNCWFHLQCTEMSEQMFDCYTQNVNLEWLCLKCGMPDITLQYLIAPYHLKSPHLKFQRRLKQRCLES